MSNYTKPEHPDGVPAWASIGAEYMNGTGQTLLWTHDLRCQDAGCGGNTECCTGDLDCNMHYMPWQEMNALGMWLIEMADVARDVQLKEEG